MLFRVNLLPVIILLLIISGTGAAQKKKAKLPVVDTVTTAKVHQFIEERNGKVTLVNVWATWCTPCKKEIPSLLKLRNKYITRGFDLIFVSADDIELARTAVPRTLRQFGVDFQTYIKHDSTDEAFIMGMSPDWNGALPTSFLYDKEGKLVDMMIGERSYEQFEKAVLPLLAK
jgi:thiol-disulfide isomerase/thioredoxin